MSADLYVKFSGIDAKEAEQIDNAIELLMKIDTMIGGASTSAYEGNPQFRQVAYDLEAIKNGTWEY